jgi:hypothetical protein
MQVQLGADHASDACLPPCRRDKSVPGAAAYQHWGQYIEDELIQPEPNSFENCAGGNFSQSYGKAAGWDDQNCDTEFIYICRMPSECPPLQGRGYQCLLWLQLLLQGVCASLMQRRDQWYCRPVEGSCAQSHVVVSDCCVASALFLFILLLHLPS